MSTNDCPACGFNHATHGPCHKTVAVGHVPMQGVASLFGLDKPENYSPHAVVSDYLVPSSAGFRCTCAMDQTATCRVHPLNGKHEEINYSKFSLPGGEYFKSYNGQDTIDASAFSSVPEAVRLLPTDYAGRKAIPVCTGVLDYFPAALIEIAKVSHVGNEQHNPGEELHWARGKSMNQADTMLRHWMERGTVDTDGVRHTAKAAWRALAELQLELEAAGAPIARGAK